MQRNSPFSSQSFFYQNDGIYHLFEIFRAITESAEGVIGERCTNNGKMLIMGENKEIIRTLHEYRENVEQKISNDENGYLRAWLLSKLTSLLSFVNEKILSAYNDNLYNLTQNDQRLYDDISKALDIIDSSKDRSWEKVSMKRINPTSIVKNVKEKMKELLPGQDYINIIVC